MVVRRYAQILGVVLLIVGVVGLILNLALGMDYLFGILNIEFVENIVHLITGGLYAYVGFGSTDVGLARNVVGALGVIYLLVGILGFFIPMIFGLIPSGYTIFDNLLHLVVGVVSVAIAWFLYRGEPATA